MTQLLTLGVIGKSLKADEKRVPIHPEHLKLIPEELRKQITFEEGYGENFGIDDNTLARLTSGRVALREEIMNGFDCVLIPKPIVSDLSEIREGTVVWGWPHCVQQKEITQVSIDKKLTLIAWEEMFAWTSEGKKGTHTFNKNNELAGYAGVNHALSLIGVSGFYGKSLKAVVIGYGSVAHGAIYALQGQCVKDILVLTDFPLNKMKNKIEGIRYKEMKNDGAGNMLVVEPDGSTIPLVEVMEDVQIIANGVFQDSDHPKMFIPESDANKLNKGTIIIDISCDEGMGFWCSKPTSFENPMFEVDGKHYYAVDHSPSYYWNSASWEISKALLPFLPEIMAGANTWDKNITISKSIEIREGVIQNPKILSFQNREKEYPHNFR
ncbi:MAG: N(5)-(carboxyethyl)ornithine synthase [Flavobacteriales bacterium]|nr:N(5)-(carboxyethyl)ornithine synthase [Flavobacteriales bacterium]